MIGKRLGPYEITAKLGEGGMGEVYRATDTKLEREVAIKVLPAAFTEDEARLSRFEREAKLLAQLHHPHIASIFGLEESEGTSALVMELVEGPTLAEKVATGPIPADEALPIARQIAMALETAHDKGIIHRDLKPQNVKLTPDGEVKVLDFGLAKAMDPGGSSTGSPMTSPTMMSSPTLTAMPGTQLGVILGTAAYMAPEQARGQAVDKRADIWAFGVVLYEMLTGAKLFAAETVSDTLAGVLKTEVDLGNLPEGTPPAIRRLLRRCLERNPKNRLRDIGDARIVLGEAAASEGEDPAREAGREGAERGRLPWAVAAICGAIALASLLYALWPRGADHRPQPALSRLSLPMPSTGAEQVPGTFALAPDGRAAVFSVVDSGRARLFVREFAEVEGRPLDGTEGARYPFWSPDSRDIAFFAGGELRRVPRGGGAVQRVCAAANGRGGAWGSRGTIVFAPDPDSPLFQVPASGGVPAPATHFGEAPEGSSGASARALSRGHRFPAFLPDGRHFLFVDDQDSTTSGWRIPIRVASLDKVSSGRLLFEATGAPRFAPPNDLVFQREGALVTQRIDLATLEMIGEPLLLADRPNLQLGTRGVAAVDLANDGRMLYAPPDPRPTAFLWLDRSGVVRETGPRSEGSIQDVAISRRGDRVAAFRREPDGTSSLWMFDLLGGEATRLTPPGLTAWAPIWSAGSTGVAVWLSKPESNSLLGSLSLISAANGEIRRLLPVSGRWMLPTDASADGLTMLYMELVGGRGWDIGSLRLDGDPATTTEYLATGANERSARLSPDGRWIVYLSDASGRTEVFLDRFPDPAHAVRVPVPGGADQVTLRADGRELFVVAAEGDSETLFAFDVLLGEVAEVGPSRKLFELPPEHLAFEPTPDGDRFLLLRPEGSRWPTLTVVENWRSQLEPER